MLAAAIDRLFDSTDWAASGACLLWDSGLIGIRACADAATGLADLILPVALALYWRRRPGIMARPAFVLCAVFLLLSGVGQAFDLLTIWSPAYRLDSLVRIAVATAGLAAAAAAWREVSRAPAPISARDSATASAVMEDGEAPPSVVEADQQPFAAIVEASPTALLVLARTGLIAMSNASAERLFGYSRAELRDQSLDMLLGSFSGEVLHLRTDFMNVVAAWATAGRPDLFGVRKDGTRFPLVVGLSSIEIEGDMMVLAGVEDITGQRESERATQRQQQALERASGELMRARLRTEQATRAKSQFLEGMSRELRTPLNGILGYAQLLDIAGGLSATQAGRVDAMRAAGEHLLGMINSVLDLSKLEAERVTLQSAEIDPEEVVRECMNLVRPGADARGLALMLDVNPELPDRVLVDQLRLRQVLLNLLSNALKFTDRGIVEARLRVVRPAAAAAALLIQIVDTGRGVPAEHRADLLRAFEQPDLDAGFAVGGGFGLVISAGLAGMMGGRISHADNPDGGSIFGLEFPLRALPAGRAPDIKAALLPPPAPAASLRVLVVDDIAMNRDIATSFLRAAGHAVTSADGGEAGVRAAANADYDVVLMDLRMPEVDGFAASRRIGALRGNRGRVPIVALTAHAFAEHVEECRQAGMVGHLAKPFTPSALLSAVANAVDDRNTEQEHGAMLDMRSDLAGLPVIDLNAFKTTAAFVAPGSLATYLENIVADIEEVRRSLDDWEGSGRVAAGDVVDGVRKLAGTVGMFGFARLTAVARRFERGAGAGGTELSALAESLSAVLEASLREARRRLTATRAGTHVTLMSATSGDAGRA